MEHTKKIIEVTNVIGDEEKKSFRGSSYYRGKNRCTKLREHTLDLITEKNNSYDVAVTEQDIIHMFYKGEIKTEEVKDLVSQGIEDTFKQQEVTRDMLRYLKSEQRTPILPKTKYFLVDGEKVKVRPALMFNDGTTIEVVFIRGCKPDVTMRGKKADTGVNQSLELWYGLIYAKSLVKEGERMNVKSSYYFLRKDNDRAFGVYDFDFFSKNGKNIVYLEESSYLGGSGVGSVDMNFFPQLDEFREGTDQCSEEDCKYCPNAVACNYQKSPETFEEKDISYKGKEVVYSDEQLAIINFRNGKARVIAKAGTGKTECMTERGARMFAEGVNPDRMLFVTFTDAGALEMKERLIAKAAAKGVVVSAEDIKAMTFHTLGYGFIKDNFEYLGFAKIPTIIDTDEATKGRLVNQILEDNDFFTLKNRYSALDWALACFDAMAANDIDPEDPEAENMLKEVISDNNWYTFMEAGEVSKMVEMFGDYKRICKENCWITFADIEPLMNKVLAEKPEYLNSLGYEHIIVDEFQDSNDAQLKTIMLLMKQDCFKSLMVVGDDCQSIYGFRNTSQENILHFWEKIDSTGSDFFMTANHRSTPEILEFADNYINAFNEDQVDARMVATREHGFKPVVKAFWKKEEEHEFIVKQVIACHDKGGYAWEDICVIGATKAELVSIAARLSDAGIPWITKYPMPLVENSRVQAAISLGMAFYQPDAENLYFNYIVAKNDGDIFEDMTNDEIKAEVADLKAEWSGMDFLEIPYQRKLFHEKLEAIKGEDELYAYFLELLYDKEDFQSELQYICDFRKFGERVAKKLDGSYAGVVLTTAHSSKGLEWPIVFNTVSGYDNKKLHTGRNKIKEREERRRLLYVSMTRARDILYLTGKCVCYGKMNEYTYNQFLDELYQIAGKEFDPIALQMGIAPRKPAKKTGSNQMTPEQIKEYEKLVKTAEQVTLADLKVV